MFRDITIPKIPAKLTGTHSFIFWDWFNEWINEHLQVNWLNLAYVAGFHLGNSFVKEFIETFLWK